MTIITDEGAAKRIIELTEKLINSFKYKIYKQGGILMTMKVGLSGFGRIGRDVLRIYAEENVNDFEIVALNASGI